MNLYGQDMDESTTPLETGLAWTVDLKAPRDFIGKSALRNAPPARHALGLVLLDKGVMRGHQQVSTAHGDGEITSGGFGPTLELLDRACARAGCGARGGRGDRCNSRQTAARARRQAAVRAPRQDTREYLTAKPPRPPG